MANQTSAQQEPTMEEILASIRRIISEDSEPAKGGAPGASAAPQQKEPEVLELTQVVAETPAPQPAKPVPQPQPERRSEPKAKPARAAEPQAEPAPRKPAPPPPQPPRNDMELDMVDKDDKPDTLVSGQTHSAISAAFSLLSRDRDVAVSAGEARTLEDIVAQMLKPMLKEWLEDNLPEMVERVVREEVERAARMSRRR